MKRNIFLLIIFLIMCFNSFSQDKVGLVSTYQYKSKYVQNEILKLISFASIENSINFNYCTLKYLITYNSEGSAGLPNCEISNDLYIVIKDGEKVNQHDRLFILKNIFNLNVKSIKFEEIEDGLILNFESTRAEKSKNYKDNFEISYNEINNRFKINFNGIKKIR